MGENKVMNCNLDCLKQGTSNWADVVIDAVLLSLKILKIHGILMAFQ